MLHNRALVSQPDHNLLETLSLQQQAAVLPAEGQIPSRLQGLAFNVIGAAACELLHCTGTLIHALHIRLQMKHTELVRLGPSSLFVSTNGIAQLTARYCKVVMTPLIMVQNDIDIQQLAWMKSQRSRV